MNFEKLKSRKFWITLVTMLVVMFSDAMGLELTGDQIQWIVATASAYLIGQGVADRKVVPSAVVFQRDPYEREDEEDEEEDEDSKPHETNPYMADKEAGPVAGD